MFYHLINQCIDMPNMLNRSYKVLQLHNSIVSSHHLAYQVHLCETGHQVIWN
jgi:hypothetical protein